MNNLFGRTFPSRFCAAATSGDDHFAHLVLCLESRRLYKPNAFITVPVSIGFVKKKQARGMLNLRRLFLCIFRRIIVLFQGRTAPPYQVRNGRRSPGRYSRFSRAEHPWFPGSCRSTYWASSRQSPWLIKTICSAGLIRCFLHAFHKGIQRLLSSPHFRHRDQMPFVIHMQHRLDVQNRAHQRTWP